MPQLHSQTQIDKHTETHIYYWLFFQLSTHSLDSVRCTKSYWCGINWEFACTFRSFSNKHFLTDGMIGGQDRVRKGLKRKKTFRFWYMRCASTCVHKLCWARLHLLGPPPPTNHQQSNTSLYTASLLAEMCLIWNETCQACTFPTAAVEHPEKLVP